MKQLTPLALTALLLILTGCELIAPRGGSGGGGLGASDRIETTADAEQVLANLVAAVRYVLPYREQDTTWNDVDVEGSQGGYATIDGDLSRASGSSNVIQMTLDTEIEFHDFCHDGSTCFDGGVDYAGWLEHVDDDDEFHGGWAIQGSVDVFGDYEDTITDMEIMIVAHDRTYGWIEAGGETFAIPL